MAEDSPGHIKQIHSVVKISINQILKEPKYTNIIESVMRDVNKIVTRGYQLLKIVILTNYINKIKYEKFYEDFFKECLDLKSINLEKHLMAHIILKNKSPELLIDRSFLDKILSCVNGGNPNIKNLDSLYIYDIYKQYFKGIEYTKSIYPLTNILKYSAIEMATCFENNLTSHFKDHINKYINLTFTFNDQIKINELKENNKIIYEKIGALNYDSKNEKQILKRQIKVNNNKMKIIREKIKAEIKDLSNLKVDLYTNSEKRYIGKHLKWLNINRDLLVPIFEKDNINYHLKMNPLSCLKYSIYINKEIEKLGRRPYQVIPQRKDNIPCYIALNATSIAYIFRDIFKDKCSLHSIILRNKLDNLLWNEINKFLTKKDISNESYKNFTTKLDEIINEFSFSFDYMFLDDIKGINKDNLENIGELMSANNRENYVKKIDLMNSKLNVDYLAQHPKECGYFVISNIFKIKMFNLKKKMVFNEIKTDGVTASIDFVNIKINKYEKKVKKENIDVSKKKPTKRELLKMKKKDNYIKLENLTNNEIKYMKKNCIILSDDPGMNYLYTISAEKIDVDLKNVKLMGKNNKNKDHDYLIYQFSSRRYKDSVQGKRMIETNKREMKTEKFKEKQKLESELSKLSSRTLDIDKFMEYVKEKDKIQNELNIYYVQRKFRKQKFTKYINKKKIEGQITREIKKKYGGKGKIKRSKKDDGKKEIIIGVGNWGKTSNMAGFFPTPNNWFRKVLNNEFVTITVDECLTSQKHYVTKKDADHMRYTINGKEEEEYQVIYHTEKKKNGTLLKNTNSTEENKRYIIHRDYNGSINIGIIIKQYLEDRTRPDYLTKNHSHLEKSAES